MLMICVMSSLVKFSTFFMGKLKKCFIMFSKLKKKFMLLLSFMSSFKCCKNFPLKINFFESNFFGRLCCGALYDLTKHVAFGKVSQAVSP